MRMRVTTLCVIGLAVICCSSNWFANASGTPGPRDDGDDGPRDARADGAPAVNACPSSSASQGLREANHARLQGMLQKATSKEFKQARWDRMMSLMFYQAWSNRRADDPSIAQEMNGIELVFGSFSQTVVLCDNLHRILTQEPRPNMQMAMDFALDALLDLATQQWDGLNIQEKAAAAAPVVD